MPFAEGDWPLVEWAEPMRPPAGGCPGGRFGVFASAASADLAGQSDISCRATDFALYIIDTRE